MEYVFSGCITVLLFSPWRCQEKNIYLQKQKTMKNTIFLAVMMGMTVSLNAIISHNPAVPAKPVFIEPCIDTLAFVEWGECSPEKISCNDYGIFINTSISNQIKVAFDSHEFYIDGQLYNFKNSPTELQMLRELFIQYVAISENTISSSITFRTHYLKAADGSWHELLIPYKPLDTPIRDYMADESVIATMERPIAVPIDPHSKVSWGTFSPSKISCNEYGIFINISRSIQIKVAFKSHLFFIDGKLQNASGKDNPLELLLLRKIFNDFVAISEKPIASSDSSDIYYLKAVDGSWHELEVLRR